MDIVTKRESAYAQDIEARAADELDPLVDWYSCYEQAGAICEGAIHNVKTFALKRELARNAVHYYDEALRAEGLETLGDAAAVKAYVSTIEKKMADLSKRVES